MLHVARQAARIADYGCPPMADRSPARGQATHHEVLVAPKDVINHGIELCARDDLLGVQVQGLQEVLILLSAADPV